MNNLMFDYQIMLMQNYGGISRYFYEVISRVPTEEFELFFSVKNNLNYYFEDFFGKPIREIANHKKYDKIIKKNQYITKRILKKKKEDIIFHPTYYNPYFLDKFRGKLVVTVHDMIHENYPEYYAGNATIEHKRCLMQKADKIVAVSRTTKNDILRIYPDIDENKIEVIYHGNGQQRVLVVNKEFEQKYLGNGKFILYVGNRDRYKNFEIFAEAVAHILSEIEEFKLICVGGGKFLPEELEIFERNRCLNKAIQISASEEELSWLYQNAECFVFPSKAEGFGIPILEAWKNQCPVVLSDIECFKEVGGDAAIYFDPDDVKSIEDKILEALEKKKRSKLIQAGKERLNGFSWDLCAQKHFQIYRDICEGI